MGVRGVRTGCTMAKTVGIRGASGVHPLYTVPRGREYGLAVPQIEGLGAPAPFQPSAFPYAVAVQTGADLGKRALNLTQMGIAALRSSRLCGSFAFATVEQIRLRAG